jgi:hypothetical protein
MDMGTVLDGVRTTTLRINHASLTQIPTSCQRVQRRSACRGLAALNLSAGSAGGGSNSWTPDKPLAWAVFI